MNRNYRIYNLLIFNVNIFHTISIVFKSVVPPGSLEKIPSYCFTIIWNFTFIKLSSFCPLKSNLFQIPSFFLKFAIISIIIIPNEVSPNLRMKKDERGSERKQSDED